MNMRNTILAAIGALSLLLGMGGAALAQVTADRPVDVKVSVSATAALKVSLVASNFTGVTYSNADQTATGSTLTVTAEDTRGTAAGWRVTLGGTNFAGVATPAKTIAIGNLKLTTGTISGGPGTAPTGSSIAAVTTTGQTILTAASGAGNGLYTQPLTGALLVNAGTLVDTYMSTLTVTITGTAP